MLHMASLATTVMSYMLRPFVSSFLVGPRRRFVLVFNVVMWDSRRLSTTVHPDTVTPPAAYVSQLRSLITA